MQEHLASARDDDDASLDPGWIRHAQNLQVSGLIFNKIVIE
jgi:hypothetical protein